ncbi:divergent polysaccharide deacetylase family protein [Sneathiella sp.]|uniref:divergent polysaccharide deacetylase family protein n=1 Tax=Sneathiella sp. TaxID=1964365 RepID=UPI0039E646CC
MKTTGNNKQVKPASGKGLSVLSVLYGLLFLSVAGLGGWLAWQSYGTDSLQQTGATTEIGVAVRVDAPADKAEPLPQEPQDPAPATETAAEPTLQAEKEPVASLPPDKKPTTEKAPTQADISSETDKDAPISDAEQTKTAEKTPDLPHPEKSDETDNRTQTPIAVTEPSKAVSEKPKVAQTGQTPEEVAEPSTEVTSEAKPSAPPLTEKTESGEPDKPSAIETPLEAKDTTKPTSPTAEKQVPSFSKLKAIPGEDTPLPPVPDPALTSKSDYGLLPTISTDGRQPWRIYRKPFEDPLNRPRIAIVMSEMGMSNQATRSAIQNLPGSVTLSFNPHGRDLQSWVEQARAAGHEVLLQLPMEPFGYPKNDPGEHSLLTSLTDRENLKRLEWMLGRFTGYSGVTNQMGSRFTASPDDIAPILSVIKERGLLFLDGRTSAKSIAGPTAAKLNIPVAINNRFLDHKADRATIDARLADLERIARFTGTAVGIGYPYPVTLDRINRWAQTLARKGYVLVPVSAAVNRQEIQ